MEYRYKEKNSIDKLPIRKGKHNPDSPF